MGNERAWWNSMPGMTPDETAQLMLVKSEDDGQTWSEPINITAQVKDPSWYFLLQGPGKGICMKDGTLVFPIQFIDSTRVPNAGIMYSKDHGKTWHRHNAARSNTTEAQVVEVEPGVFSNPNTTKGRNHITIKASLDGGITWPESCQLLLDENEGWGYTCLSMIDRETIGIFYESSVAHMTFQAISLRRLISH